MTAGAAPAGTALASGTATCSPITEVGTGTTETNDYIFLSVTQNGSLTASGAGCKGTGAAGACVYSFNLGTSASTPAAGLLANGGTGAIIIDNVSGAQGASQIYYTTLSSEACKGQNGTGPVGPAQARVRCRRRKLHCNRMNGRGGGAPPGALAMNVGLTELP